MGKINKRVFTEDMGLEVLLEGIEMCLIQRGRHSTKGQHELNQRQASLARSWCNEYSKSFKSRSEGYEQENPCGKSRLGAFYGIFLSITLVSLYILLGIEEPLMFPEYLFVAFLSLLSF